MKQEKEVQQALQEQRKQLQTLGDALSKLVHRLEPLLASDLELDVDAKLKPYLADQLPIACDLTRSLVERTGRVVLFRECVDNITNRIRC